MTQKIFTILSIDQTQFIFFFPVNDKHKYAGFHSLHSNTLKP